MHRKQEMYISQDMQRHLLALVEKEVGPQLQEPDLMSKLVHLVLAIGDAQEVAEKIIRHSEALGGITRFSFQMDNAKLSHEQLMDAIEIIGKEVSPIVNS